MAYYEVPKEYYFRIHHPRPRFKGDIENVLIYLASEITLIGRKKVNEFKSDLDFSIKKYPGNLTKKQKTIDNWRTEIDALFSFVVKEGDYLKPSNRAIELATNQDLVKFFKLFCYHFQYPGGFVKPHVNLMYIKEKINFRPASYILKMLSSAETEYGKRAGITKSEATHCIFNDLRVSRDNRSCEETWELISSNRRKKVEYDWTGDVIRYAGDILDYLTQGNLLVKRPDGKYYINTVESLAIQRFINSTDFFDYYSYIQNPYEVNLDEVKTIDQDWIKYFNTEREEGFFDTDILALVSESSNEYNQLRNMFDIERVIEEGGMDTTGGIGSVGESLILNHEKIRIEHEGRSDLKHLIKLIPSTYAVGYDINSREVDETHKFIEVKTTKSSTEIDFMRFHLTPNEWSAAETHSDRYFVYRLLVTKGRIKLIILKDPVGEYKRGNLSATPRNGMDIIFNPEVTGIEKELLIQKDGA
ncbi:protein NO VEIN domain-containing protein [Bacillus horti]|uniref:DUF3883 domain-containing protein n=1 Tax=Caldalkalibacillus horti TaxID=77523 RepID=A0ABT9W1P6_9BACI|nr:DUF3883 domain-containing protein [Bacillus horti]MDQ0167181.1 hypothetical protein [Bacillus horti]